MSFFNILRRVIIMAILMGVVMAFEFGLSMKSNANAITNSDGLGYSGIIEANPLGDNITMTGYKDWPSGVTFPVEKFGAGVYDGENIWMVPYSSSHIIKINKSTGVMTGYNLWPGGFSGGNSSFRGAVFDGQNIWLIPRNANMLVKVNKDTGAMTGYNSFPVGINANDTDKFIG